MNTQSSDFVKVIWNHFNIWYGKSVKLIVIEIKFTIDFNIETGMNQCFKVYQSIQVVIIVVVVANLLTGWQLKEKYVLISIINKIQQYLNIEAANVDQILNDQTFFKVLTVSFSTCV